MNDFIFGTLATDELKLRHIRSLRAGITHRSRRNPRDPNPGQPVIIEISAGPAHPVVKAWVAWTTDGKFPDRVPGRSGDGNITILRPTEAVWDTLLWGYTQHFQASIPGQPADTVVRYRMGITTPDGLYEWVDDGTCYGYYVADDPTPAWANDAIIYEIFVDRFYPGQGKSWLQPPDPSGFFGGTLRGITEKLDDLETLGVNTLWLTPIFPSPTHHGYDATDYFEIEPRLGTKADFRDLLDQAHARGVRVLLDYVPNHWSNLHATFQEAIREKDSPYREWYLFERWPDRYDSFFGVKSLPRLNLLDSAARKHILDAACYWLDFGVDGFRLDHASGPTPDFWADFRRATRSVRPDCWMFGEVVDPPDYQLSFEGLLDGCLDFNLLEGIRQTIAFGRWSAEQFASFLDRHEAYFPPTFSRPSFLDNHDMNRFLWAAEGNLDKLRLAAMCQFTLAGPPVIYYGTEVGLSQERDTRQGERGIPEESRLPMLWGDAQDLHLKEYYQALISLRKHWRCLRSGACCTTHPGDRFLVYQRTGQDGPLVIALNLGDVSQRFPLPKGIYQPLLSSRENHQVQDGEQVKDAVELPGLTGVILHSVDPNG